jgi:short-subunit dehydrogenase
MKCGTALVTGASRGIGKAIAQALVEDGWKVIGACRKPSALAESDRVSGVRYIAADLAKPPGVAALMRQVKAVDLLVNNAGASLIGPAEEAPAARIREHLELNLVSAIRLSQAVLPAMRKRGSGAILFIGSMRSEAPSPFSSIYSAGKAALRSFAECLRMEVKSAGIRISLIAPMHIRTTLPQELEMKLRSPYAAAVARVKASRDRMMAEAADPSAMARLVVKIARQRYPRAFYTAGRLARIQAFLARHLPRGVVEATMARKFRLPT